MASRGPRPVEIVLTAGEREQLGRWARRRRTAAGLATRSRIVLACAAAESNASIARRLEVARPTVAKWRARFAAERMAAASGLSQSTVSRLWRTFGLQPHRVEDGKLSKDPLFVEKVRDIVGLYVDPPERLGLALLV